MAETSGKYDRRNFVLNVAEGALFVAGSSLISSQTVFPALIVRLGGGNILIGAFGVISWVGLFLPQIFAARHTQTIRWKKPWAVRYGAIQRFFILAIGLVILLGGKDLPAAACALILALFGLNQIFTGITTPGWFDMYAKLTPLNRRGRLVGMRNALAGAGAFLCSFALTWILTSFDFPLNFTFPFIAAFALQFLSVILQSRLVEEYPSQSVPFQSLREYLRELVELVRTHRHFRSFLTASAFFILASLPLSFFTVYGLEKFKAGESAVGEFTIAIVIGQFLGGIINGYIADRHGNRLALLYATASMACASAWALLAPTLLLFDVVFLLVGINLGSELMIRYNLASEFGSTERRSTYIGVMNTLLSPLYLFSLAAGWLSEKYGYVSLFGAGCACSVIGIVLLLSVVIEPRISGPRGNRTTAEITET
ncbi:MAG TPA: MFS transporter [Bacteroidota bacterium]|nr:MFS transporter [Bacteroidota bacterium]